MNEEFNPEVAGDFEAEGTPQEAPQEADMVVEAIVNSPSALEVLAAALAPLMGGAPEGDEGEPIVEELPEGDIEEEV